MKIKIKVTKEVINKALLCGTASSKGPTNENCAIALAVRDIFPHARIHTYRFFPLPVYDRNGFFKEEMSIAIQHSPRTTRFIQQFDALRDNIEERKLLPEYEFSIVVPAKIISKINIDDILKSETLELVS